MAFLFLTNIKCADSILKVMNKKINISMEEIEKSALYSENGKSSLSSIFGKKEEFKKHLLNLEYRWNLASFPKEMTNLLRNFINIGTIYVLIDEKLRSSVSTYVNTIIHILEKETNRQTFLLSINESGKNLEETLIPYFSEFSRSYKPGAILFHILIKCMLSSILRNETKDKSREFVKRVENEITTLTNNILRFVRKKSRLPLKESVTRFIDGFLLKIPIHSRPITQIGLDELEDIFLLKGFSMTLFNELYEMLTKELRQTIEKNLLLALFSQKIESKKDLYENIDVPISKTLAEEITKTLKQSAIKKLSSLKEKKRQIEKEIEKNFDGFNETSILLWNSINLEIESIRGGKNSANLDEVTNRSNVLSSFITKKMWSIRELMSRKKKLDTTMSNIRQLEGLSTDQLVKYSSEIENVSKIEGLTNFYFAFIKHYGRSISKLPPKIIAGAEKILKLSEKKKNKDIIDTFCEKHFIGMKYFPDRFILRFLKCFEDAIIPLYIEDNLIRFFSLWPPATIKEGSEYLPYLEKEVLYVGDFLIPEKEFLKMGTFPISTEKEEKDFTIITKLVNKFSRVVSVLVYDIRGSTFMGTKLGNAKKESFIRKKFSERMLEVAEEYGAFPIKDTGDGGILFFSQNSRELCGKIFAPGKIGNEWIRLKCEKEELEPEEGEESVRMAILTAKQMMLEAQKFVSDNLSEYSDWFKEVKERELFFKGMSYAQLPPSYKRIFQIGIGITSGHIEKDVHFSINAFGDPDITGNLVRDANLYSKARQPESSVILMDSSSLLNLLLNEDIIEPVVEEEKIRGFSETEIYRYLLDKTFQLARARTRKVAYKLENYGLIIKRIGYRILEEGKDERIIPELTISDLGLKITDAGEIKDTKGGTIKFLYEVSLEE